MLPGGRASRHWPALSARPARSSCWGRHAKLLLRTTTASQTDVPSMRYQSASTCALHMHAEMGAESDP